MTLREKLGRLDRRQQAIWLALIWLLLPAIVRIWWDERTLPDIRGRWIGQPCEEVRSQDGLSRVKRSLRVEEDEWNLVIDFFGDEACTDGIFRFDVSGPYDLGPKSMEVRGATTARFDLGKMLLTPLSTDAVAAFDGARCAAGGWKIGEAQEVTEFGCLGLVPTRSSCPVEYDIVKIEDDALHLRDRSRGLCATERYPTRFAPAPLRRFEPERP